MYLHCRRPALPILIAEPSLPRYGSPRIPQLNLIGVRETWRGSRGNDAISSSTLDGMMKKAPKSSVETRPDLINTALLLLLQVDILWNPARQNVRVLAAISPAVSKASVRFEEGFFDEGWPQFAILSRESAHKFVTGLDENAMIDFHTARNAVEEEADVVFAKTIDSGSAVCLWVNNARNQGFFKARLVESAGNHRRNDCAIIDTVLRMNQGEKTTFTFRTVFEKNSIIRIY